MVGVGYTYLRTKFMVVVPMHGHDGAYHDCDHALMAAIPTELSHVTFVIYGNPLSRELVYLQQLFIYKEVTSRQNWKLYNIKKTVK